MTFEELEAEQNKKLDDLERRLTALEKAVKEQQEELEGDNPPWQIREVKWLRK